MPVSNSNISTLYKSYKIENLTELILVMADYLLTIFEKENIKTEINISKSEQMKLEKFIDSCTDSKYDDFNYSLTTYLLKLILTKMIVDFNEVKINSYALSNELNLFLVFFNITKDKFIENFNYAKEEKASLRYLDKNMKRTLAEVKSELPLMLQRIFDISVGAYVKNDGVSMTLKEYARLSNQDEKILIQLLSSARKLIDTKLKNRKINEQIKNSKENA